jgi:hypothetical protein
VQTTAIICFGTFAGWTNGHPMYLVQQVSTLAIKY